MSRKKLSLGQKQFRFPDEDLKTSLHDEIVLWVMKHSRELSQKILGWRENWDAEVIEKHRSEMSAAVEERKKNLRMKIAERLDKSELTLSLRTELSSLESWVGLADPPPPRLELASKLEVPITRERYRGTDIIGYSDIVIFTKVNRLATSISTLSWGYYLDDRGIALDAKTTIPSIGQILRQLNTYEAYCPWPFYVVSPEARFAEEISSEGFGFIEYPDGVFLQPRYKISKALYAPHRTPDVYR